MKQTLAILLIITTLASCKKSSDNRYYTITGLVLDWDSKAPIAGAKVYAGTSFFNPATNDSAITDANGMVSFRYLKSEPGRRLYTNIPGYLSPFFSFFCLCWSSNL